MLGLVLPLKYGFPSAEFQAKRLWELVLWPLNHKGRNPYPAYIRIFRRPQTWLGRSKAWTHRYRRVGDCLYLVGQGPLEQLNLLF